MGRSAVNTQPNMGIYFAPKRDMIDSINFEENGTVHEPNVKYINVQLKYQVA